MSMTNRMMAATVLLLGLTARGVGLIDAGSEHPLAVGRTAVAPVFPDGLVHDFGKVQAGAQATYAFRIVNASHLPLQVLSVRVG